MWESSIANARFSDDISVTVWSSCSKFIAIATHESSTVVVLDGATLGQLHTVHPQSHDIDWDQLIFSPDGHLLAAYSYYRDCIVSWDLQTGGLISNICTVGERCKSMTYSECGTMLGGLFGQRTIMIYNTSSGMQISSYSLQESTVVTIWTHREHLQFATIDSESITIWKVGFTSNCIPTQINSLPGPDNLSKKKLVFLPALYYLAFVDKSRVVVWDAQCQKILLNSADVDKPQNISFSCDGNFLACGTKSSKFYLWKKSPDRYLLHATQTSNVSEAIPVVSPNGGSVISFGDSTIFSSGSILQLWHTTYSPTSSISIQPSQHSKNFLLEFFPDKPLVAATEWLGKTVTILNVKSGSPQLVIDAGTEICGIGIIERKIMVVCDGKIVTWELPAGDCAPNLQWNIENSVQTTKIECPEPIEKLYASISPDLNYVAFGSLETTDTPSICDIHTGKNLATAWSNGTIPEFTLGGTEVCCARASGVVDKWAIVKDDGSKTIKLEQLWEMQIPQGGLSWHSPCGFQVTDDGWVLNPGGKQLLWLPHQWQSMEVKRRWNGKFLAVFPSGLPEPLILELEV